MGRKIDPKLVEFIDKKLKTSGLAQHAIETKDARTLVCEAAKAMVGIKEATGRNDGKMVGLIQKTVGLGEGAAWCAAFVNTCIAYAEEKCGVVSPVVNSGLAQDLYNKTPKAQRVKNIPLAGAIAVWGDIGKSTGHTEIVISAGDKTWQGVGGNTGGSDKPGGEVTANGNGVYFTTRTFSDTKKRKLLGFVRPF